MNPMEPIWEEVSTKAEEGQKYILLKDKVAVVFFYVTGFVDDSRYSLTEWLNSFQTSLQKDGSYRVTKEQWLEKEKFRYSGPLGTLFDPETIEERDYSEKELVAVFKEKILPHTILGEEGTPDMLVDLRSKKQLVNGKLKMTRKLKDEIVRIINEHPSPTRMRQLIAQEVKKNQRRDSQKEQSQFTTGIATEKLIQNRLAELSKQLKEEKKPLSKEPTISLKDLQKKKGPRGRV